MGGRLAVSRRRARGDGQALITRGAITRIAHRDGVSAPVVERDYVLTHIVQALAQLEPPAGLVFKGGTALRLCFYEDYRYSADLDFSLVGLNVSEAVAPLRRALERCAEAIGLPQLALPDADPLLIHYVGPLDGAPGLVRVWAIGSRANLVAYARAATRSTRAEVQERRRRPPHRLRPGAGRVGQCKDA